MEKEQQQKSKKLKKPKKTRRGKRKSEILNKNFSIVGTNAAGLKNKMPSLQNCITQLRPGVVFIQETKLYRKGQIKINEYEIFEQTRDKIHGGGLMIAAHEALEPVLVTEGDENAEILTVQGNVGGIPVRFMTGYGPQENEILQKKLDFYQKLDEEFQSAKEAEAGIILELDANAKIGPEKDKISPNGQLLLDVVKAHSLTIVNSLPICEGKITRSRITDKLHEKSSIDYIIVCDQMLPFVSKMKIDEEKAFVLTKFSKTKGKIDIKESDHNILICNFEIKVNKAKKSKREEILNLKNKEGQQKFFDITDSTSILSESFKNNEEITKQTNNWHKNLQRIQYQSFKKIRITNRAKLTEEDLLLQNRTKLKQKLGKAENIAEKNKIIKQLEDNDSDIAIIASERNRTIIKDHFKDITNIDGGFCQTKMWKLKTKVFPKSRNTPTVKRDKMGNIVTTQNGLKKLYADVYFKDRLVHNKLDPKFAKLQYHKNELLQERLQFAREIKTKPWTLHDIQKQLKKLKNNKTRDPLKLINEIFKPGIGGRDLTDSLVIMMNQIKDKLTVPELMRLSNITSIYKNKGDRRDLNNDRGIFILTCIRSILDKLIYEDEYETFDKNMSDSNIGARKHKNIRNHLFIVYGVINHVIEEKQDPIDIQVFDIEKCFDKLELNETLNDAWDTGLQNDKLVLLHELNKKSNVAIKTPVGMTDRKEVEGILQQGGSWAGLLCSNELDIIGKKEQKTNEYIYEYKETISIPTLALVDDLFKITKCGVESLKANAEIGTKVEMKNLKFGINKEKQEATKCQHIHIGKPSAYCPSLKVHDVAMKKVPEAKYLGDIITAVGTMHRNIETRGKKSIGIISQIMSILKGLSLGIYYFSISVLLRNLLFVNSVLVNSEIWFPIKESDFKALEAADKLLLRRILEAPASCPTSLLYLDLGCTPIIHIIKCRRIMFLHYLLTRNPEDLIYKFFQTMIRKPTKGDWIEIVRKDLQDFDIKESFHELTTIKSEILKRKVKTACKKYSFNILMNQIKKKGETLIFKDLEMQEYLKSQRLNTSEAKFLFKIRSEMLQVKCNFKHMYLNRQHGLSCSVCLSEPETMKHVATCPELNKTLSVDYEDLFSLNDETVAKAVKSYREIWRLREESTGQQ